MALNNVYLLFALLFYLDLSKCHGFAVVYTHFLLSPVVTFKLVCHKFLLAIMMILGKI